MGKKVGEREGGKGSGGGQRARSGKRGARSMEARR